MVGPAGSYLLGFVLATSGGRTHRPRRHAKLAGYDRRATSRFIRAVEAG